MQDAETSRSDGKARQTLSVHRIPRWSEAVHTALGLHEHQKFPLFVYDLAEAQAARPCDSFRDMPGGHLIAFVAPVHDDSERLVSHRAVTRERVEAMCAVGRGPVQPTCLVSNRSLRWVPPTQGGNETTKLDALAVLLAASGTQRRDPLTHNSDRVLP